ncbi:CBS domain-containing protein [Flindersiella endophytica]
MRSYKTVADVMTRDLISAEPSRSFKDITYLLSAKGISAVPVLDSADRPLGVISEWDLILKEEPQAPPPQPGWLGRRFRTVRSRAAAPTAEELMSSPAVTIEQGATLRQAASLMAGRHITRLIVVDHRGVAVGIVTRSDLLRAFLVSDAELRRAVQRDVVEYALWPDPRAIRVDVHDGVVTLTGELGRRSLLPIAELMARQADGVVDVVNKLAYTVDDTISMLGTARSATSG